jgi:hypothetical protein
MAGNRTAVQPLQILAADESRHRSSISIWPAAMVAVAEYPGSLDRAVRDADVMFELVSCEQMAVIRGAA